MATGQVEGVGREVDRAKKPRAQHPISDGPSPLTH
jgi:hypothetical protein